jgi:ribonuclease P protein component
VASESLGRYRRISRRDELELALRTGLVMRTPYFRARYLRGEGPPGVAFLAGRKVGGAVRRNRAKRVLREAFRTSKADLSGVETLVFTATELAATARYSDIRQSLQAELDRISGETAEAGEDRGHGRDPR